MLCYHIHPSPRHTIAETTHLLAFLRNCTVNILKLGTASYMKLLSSPNIWL